MSVAFTRSMKLFTRNLVGPLVAVLIFMGGTVAAIGDDDDARDHELARQVLSEGRILPLAEITKIFKTQFAGEIVGVELEVKAANTFVYEFKVLTQNGKLKEVKVDAKTARILKIEDDD